MQSSPNEREDNGKKSWREKLRGVMRYPLMVLFFAFLAGFTIIDTVKPAKEMSEFENRRLKQAPPFSLTAFMNNQWTMDFGEFVRDQFLFRDEFVNMHSLLEEAQGALENGGVWFAKDGYQIMQNSTFSAQQQRVFPLNQQAVTDLAALYPGQVNVMIVPSPAYIMRDKLRYSPPQIDERGMTDAMFSLFGSAGARVIDVRGAFEAAEQAGEQLYYRTDHHWTTDGGALLAYEALCGALDLQAAPPSASLRREVPGFLGTNFMKSKRFGTVPDTLVYYDLPNTMTYWVDEGTQPVSAGLMNMQKLGTMDKYAAFLYGNNGYCEIEGDGEGSILVVKDSYANCFVPYLTANYAKIGVVDMRNWMSLSGLMEQEAFDDILILYSFPSFTEDADVLRILR